MEDALDKFCQYYNSDEVARQGRSLIEMILTQYKHLHCRETLLADWGFEVQIYCDHCRERESHRVTNGTVHVATALILARHRECKPKPRSHLHLVN